MAVLVGGLIILVVLAGVRLDAPRFGWSAAADLPATILAASNVSRWLQLGLLLLVPAAAGARLMGVRFIPFVIGFAVLYGWRGSRRSWPASRARAAWDWNM